MKKKPRFSISKDDKKTSKKSLDELRKESGDQIDGDDVQGGWLQFGGGIITADSSIHPDDDKV